MKKLTIIIILLTSAISFSQTYTNNDRNQVNNIRYGLFNKCTNEWLVEPTRRLPNDASEDLEIWDANGNNEVRGADGKRCWEVQAKGGLRHDYSTRWLNKGKIDTVYITETIIDTITIKETIIDSVFVETPLIKSYKDTTIVGTLINRIHEQRANKFYKVFFYTKDSLNNETAVIKVRTYSDTLTLDCTTCKFLPTQAALNIRFHYEGENILQQEYEEFENGFQIEFEIERGRDSTEVRTQNYANDFWNLWHREGSTMKEMREKKFTFISGNPGNGLGDVGTETYTGAILRRHTHYSKDVYCEMLAIQKNTGFAKLLDVIYNTYYKSN